MLKRIRESDVRACDAVEVEAVALLRSENPLGRSIEREQRIWTALQNGPAPRRPLLLRPAVIVAVLLGVGGVAVATGSALRRFVTAGPRSVAPAVSPAPRAASQATRPSAAAAEPAPEPAPTPAPAPETAPAVAAAAPAVSAAPRATVHAPRAPRVVAAPAESSRLQESAVLVRAAHTLNQLHQPAETARLIDDYFRRFPSGLLHEEALALGIQAAAAQGSPRRIELAKKYLARFPAGRFGDLARQQLAGTP